MLRLWLLVVLTLAGAFAPSRACAHVAETRTGDFFAATANARLESEPQVAGTHQSNDGHGYELASGSSQAAETTAVTVAEDAVRFHHPFPKYLGGEVQQILEPLPKSLHDAFHSGLDKILPRQAGTAFYDSMSPAARSQMLQDLGAYTKAFDAKNGTQLFDAMLREGFPGTP